MVSTARQSDCMLGTNGSNRNSPLDLVAGGLRRDRVCYDSVQGSGSIAIVPFLSSNPTPHHLEVRPLGKGLELISSTWYRPGPRPSITRVMPSGETAVPIGSPLGSLTRRMRGMAEGLRCHKAAASRGYLGLRLFCWAGGLITQEREVGAFRDNAFVY
jgi:hypothetical protein